MNAGFYPGYLRWGWIWVYAVLSGILFGALGFSIAAEATHDPNDFFALEASFPGVVWEAIHGVAGSATSVWAVGNQGGVPFVAKRTSGAWAQDATFPTVGVTRFNGSVLDVFVSSSTDVWVVGGLSNLATSKVIFNNIAHWDGAAWGLMSTPAGTGSSGTNLDRIDSVWASSATNVWFSGAGERFAETSQSVRTRILSFDGANWVAVFQETGGATANVGSGVFTTGASTGAALRQCEREISPVSSCIFTIIPPGFQQTGIETDGGGMWASSLSLIFLVGTEFVIGGNNIIHAYRWDGSALTDEAVPTMNPLRAVFGTSPTDIWAVGDAGTIIHNAGTGWTLEPALAGSEGLRAVYASSAALVWVVSDQGNIFKLQVNPATGVPSLAGLQWDPADLIVHADDACLGDEVALTINLEPSLGAGGLNWYVINSDTNVVVETGTGATFHNLNNKHFHTSRAYPTGEYTFLVTADVIGLLAPDNWAAQGFNVDTGSCFTAAEYQDIINRINDARGDIITEINNANSTTAGGGLLALGAFTGYTLGETTVILFFFVLMLWAMYQGYFLMAFAAFIGALLPIVEAFDPTTTTFEHGFIITFTLLMLAIWLEVIVRGWRLRKKGILQGD